MQNNVTTLLRRIAGAAGLAVLCALPSQAQPMAVPRSVVLFPLDKPAAVDQSVADTLLDGIRTRLAANPNWEAVTFYMKSPLVQRALQSNALTQTQVTGPFTAESASAIAKTLEVGYSLVGSIEDANADPTGKGSVTVSLQLVSSEGKTVGTAGVSGSATGAAMASDAVLRLAADNAAEKAVAQLFPAPATSVGRNGAVRPGTTTSSQAPAGLPTGSITSNQGRKKSNSMLLIGGLALVGIIIAASSGHGGGGSGSGGNGGNPGGGPPPFPF